MSPPPTASDRAPSIKKSSFDCPHCGTFTHHDWFRVRANRMDKGDTPEVYNDLEEVDASVSKWKTNEAIGSKTPAEQGQIVKLYRDLLINEMNSDVRLDSANNNERYDHYVALLFLSKCFTCHKPAVWRRDRLLYPPVKGAEAPNPDMSDDVRRDYEEARTILDLSPRGAAALLRLAIEKLCGELGYKGKIDDSIGKLVSRGLDTRVQKALDVVRVIGNDAVHPGQMDIRDDRETATKLFSLVNIVVQKFVSDQNQLSALYDKLPEAKRAAIEKRDRKEP